ncbi:hypothetical protein ACFQ2B_02200 [Streptomyces stramineus]
MAGTAHYAAGVILKKHSSPESLHRSRAHLLKVLEIFEDVPAPGDGHRPFLLMLFTLAMLAELDLQFGDFASARPSRSGRWPWPRSAATGSWSRGGAPSCSRSRSRTRTG